MGYSIFISHSSKDIELVNYISSRLQYYKIMPIIAQNVRPKEHPQYLSNKIKNLIQKSNCVVALLTKNGVNSNWVHQEIGYTLDKKPLIPLVESDIPSSELAFLEGMEYVPVDRENPDDSISTLVSWSVHLKLEKEKKELLVLLGAAVIVGLILWWLSKKKTYK